MSDEYTPTLEDAKRTYAYIQGGLDQDEGYTPFYQVHEEAFDRMIAALIREAKAEAWAEAIRHVHFGAQDEAEMLGQNPYREGSET